MAKLGIDEILEKPCWVIDILPERVPEDSEGQYFTIEKYYRREPQVSLLRRKFADVVLKLNCYYDISVIGDFNEAVRMADSEEAADLVVAAAVAGAEVNPAPSDLAGLFEGPGTVSCVRVMIGGEDTLIVSDKDDTYMAVYNPSERLLGLVSRIAEAEGLFVWRS